MVAERKDATPEAALIRVIHISLHTLPKARAQRAQRWVHLTGEYWRCVEMEQSCNTRACDAPLKHRLSIRIIHVSTDVDTFISYPTTLGVFLLVLVSH